MKAVPSSAMMIVNSSMRGHAIVDVAQIHAVTSNTSARTATQQNP